MKEGDNSKLLSLKDFQSLVQNAPLVSMDFMIRDKDGKFLVGKRNNEPAKGYWFFPGGRILKNETRAAAFSRLTLVGIAHFDFLFFAFVFPFRAWSRV